LLGRVNKLGVIYDGMDHYKICNLTIERTRKFYNLLTQTILVLSLPREK
jgi:hypothetical protein